MIESGTYTSRIQGDDRTAGYMPVAGRDKSVEAGHFDKLVKESSSADGTKEVAEKKSDHYFSFLDFIKGIIDIINPLQHIPVISTIYRHITGDEISPVARIAGGALFGGPVGAAVSVANVAVEGATGKDIGENMMAMVTKDKKEGAGVQLAAAKSEIIWETPPENIAAASPQAPAANDSGAENTRLALLALKQDLKKNFMTNDHKTDFSDTPGPAPTKLSYRTGSSGNEPSALAESGVHPMKAASAVAGSPMPARAVKINPALHSQKAPAAKAENRALPPELIAQQAATPQDVSKKMMDALDQYAAMKRAQVGNGTWAAF